MNAFRHPVDGVADPAQVIADLKDAVADGVTTETLGAYLQPRHASRPDVLADVLRQTLGPTGD